MQHSPQTRATHVDAENAEVDADLASELIAAGATTQPVETVVAVLAAPGGGASINAAAKASGLTTGLQSRSWGLPQSTGGRAVGGRPTGHATTKPWRAVVRPEGLLAYINIYGDALRPPAHEFVIDGGGPGDYNVHRECDSYAPGHQIHWIHFNHSMREPSVVIPVAASVDDDGLVHIEGDDLSLVRWNHRPALVRAALERFGGRADWKPRWYLLAVPTAAFMGSARSVFSLAALNKRTPCPPGA
jgi:hypothetical protein